MTPRLAPLLSALLAGCGNGAAVQGVDPPLDAGDRPLDAGDRPLGAGDRPLDAGDRPLDAGDPPLDAGDLQPAPPRPGLAEFDGLEIEQLLSLRARSRPAEPDSTNAFADSEDAASFGEALFFATNLSPKNVGCVLCHAPAKGFSQRLSYDGKGGLGFRNVPTLIGVAGQPWFFWDGRADSAWAQFPTPLEHVAELGSDRLFLAHALASDPFLTERYAVAFGPLPDLSDHDRFPSRGRPPRDGDEAAPEETAALNAAWSAMAPLDQRVVNDILVHSAKSVAAFERRLEPSDAPFDLFADALASGDLEGLALLSNEARQGAKLFIGRARCFACHSGPLLSDGEFHNVGLPPHPSIPADPGRAAAIAQVLDDPFNAAGLYSDDPDGARAQRLGSLAPNAELVLGAMRTPSLRNVAATQPYGHDGRFSTLVELLRFKLSLYGRPELGTRDPALSPIVHDEAELNALVAFLETLTSPPPVDL